jgi:5-formyltetrahydrofolate cyclo-ligase
VRILGDTPLISLEKTLLRQRILSMIEAEMQGTSLAVSQASAQQAVASLMASSDFLKSRVVLAYVSFSTEISTDTILNNILQTGKVLVLPRTTTKRVPMTLHRVIDLKNDLEKNRMGFLQPRKILPVVNAAELDLVIAPGVAFDTQGHRLGRGAAYYDRLLADPTLKAAVAAMALDLQIVDTVPVEPHDMKISMIYTPTRVIRCTS